MILLKTGLWGPDNLDPTVEQLLDDPTSSCLDVSLLEDNDPELDDIIKQVIADGRCLSV